MSVNRIVSTVSNITSVMGAETLVYCATEKSLEKLSGRYFRYRFAASMRNLCFDLKVTFDSILIYGNLVIVPRLHRNLMT